MSPHLIVVKGSRLPPSVLVFYVDRFGLSNEYNFKIATITPCKALQITNQLDIEARNCKEY